MTIRYGVFALILSSQLASGVLGQPYEMTQSAISNGGGSSTGVGYEITGTVGQSILGNSSGSGRRVRGGFWQSDIAPTAAPINISGRVFASELMGLPNTAVVITLSDGSSRTTRTSSFGYFRFDEIDAGQTIFLEVRSKGRLFDPQVLNVNADVADLEFFPLP